VGLEGGSVQRSATDSDELNQLGLTFDQLGEYSYVIDLVYRAKTTQLLDAARAHGARTVDGLEILVQQGALSLQLWTGRQPSRDIMRQAASRDPAAD
jgi:shikimate dehydrogenase